MDSLLEKQCTCIRSTGKAIVASPQQHARSIHFAPPFRDYSRPSRASPIKNSSVSSSFIETPLHSGTAPTNTSSTKGSHARELSILAVRYKTTTGIATSKVDGLGKGSRFRTIESLHTARSEDSFHTTKQSMADEASRVHGNNNTMVDVRRRTIMYIRSVALIDFRSSGRQYKPVKLRPVHLAGQSMRNILVKPLPMQVRYWTCTFEGFY